MCVLFTIWFRLFCFLVFSVLVRIWMETEQLMTVPCSMQPIYVTIWSDINDSWLNKACHFFRDIFNVHSRLILFLERLGAGGQSEMDPIRIYESSKHITFGVVFETAIIVWPMILKLLTILKATIKQSWPTHCAISLLTSAENTYWFLISLPRNLTPWLLHVGAPCRAVLGPYLKGLHRQTRRSVRSVLRAPIWIRGKVP